MLPSVVGLVDPSMISLLAAASNISLVLRCLDFEPSLDAFSLRFDIISPIKLLSLAWSEVVGIGLPWNPSEVCLYPYIVGLSLAHSLSHTPH